MTNDFAARSDSFDPGEPFGGVERGDGLCTVENAFLSCFFHVYASLSLVFRESTA